MSIDLNALNSATKYPSIPTYHFLGDGGVLAEDAVPFSGAVHLTEKVDGAGARIVLLPDGDWFIGSREELLTARGDRIANPAQGIVAVLRPLAKRLARRTDSDRMRVLFLEVYGHRIGPAAEQYTGEGRVGHRLLDLAWLSTDVLDLAPQEIASWRDGGGQLWSTEAKLRRAAEEEDIPLAPRLGTVRAGEGGQLPLDVASMRTFLSLRLPVTKAPLDEGAAGRPEGIVLRSENRSLIAKARFADYEHTLRRRAQSASG